MVLLTIPVIVFICEMVWEIYRDGLPKNLTLSSATTIITTLIGIESLLIGFILVAYFFLCQEYADYYTSIKCLQQFVDDTCITEKSKMIKLSLSNYFGMKLDAPKYINYSFILNFLMLSVNTLSMLMLLVQLDASVETSTAFISDIMTGHIYTGIFTLILSIVLVFFTLLFINLFISMHAEVKLMEKNLLIK